MTYKHSGSEPWRGAQAVRPCDMAAGISTGVVGTAGLRTFTTRRQLHASFDHLVDQRAARIGRPARNETSRFDWRATLVKWPELTDVVSGITGVTKIL